MAYSSPMPTAPTWGGTPERVAVIESGLEAADGPTGRDAARPMKGLPSRQEDGEEKAEMIEPAAGVDAEIETGPAEFGGRRQFKHRRFCFGRQIRAARRASARQE